MQRSCKLSMAMSGLSGTSWKCSCWALCPLQGLFTSTLSSLRHWWVWTCNNLQFARNLRWYLICDRSFFLSREDSGSTERNKFMVICGRDWQRFGLEPKQRCESSSVSVAKEGARARGARWGFTLAALDYRPGLGLAESEWKITYELANFHGKCVSGCF